MSWKSIIFLFSVTPSNLLVSNAFSTVDIRNVNANKVRLCLKPNFTENDGDNVGTLSRRKEMMENVIESAKSRPSYFTSNSASARREWLKNQFKAITATATVLTSSSSLVVLPSASNAAETVGKDPDCNGPMCTGVWDGLLADCPHGKITMSSGAGCASSQDDTPGVFAEP